MENYKKYPVRIIAFGLPAPIVISFAINSCPGL